MTPAYITVDRLVSSIALSSKLSWPQGAFPKRLVRATFWGMPLRDRRAYTMILWRRWVYLVVVEVVFGDV